MEAATAARVGGCGSNLRWVLWVQRESGRRNSSMWLWEQLTTDAVEAADRRCSALREQLEAEAPGAARDGRLRAQLRTEATVGARTEAVGASQRLQELLETYAN
jgi:hypothetical protein